jgi:putative transposase
MDKKRNTKANKTGKHLEQVQGFDFGAALSALQGGQSFTGPDGVLTPLIKQLTEAMLNAEIEAHLSSQKEEPDDVPYDDSEDIRQTTKPNRRNGYTSKTIKAPSGSFELDTPRDRLGTFEPQLVKKHQTWLSTDMEEKIISLFSLGMSYRDISANIMDLYGIEVSTATMTAVTDKLIPALEAWQTRPLEKTYPIVWMDAVHYKVKEGTT